MLEEVFSYFCLHAHHAHWILFGLLLLTGMNIPISEDLLLIAGGVLVSTCAHEQYYLMWLFLYIGCVCSAYEAYWIGRHFGPKLYKLYGFRHIITRERIARLRTFIERYGVFTFVVGRFIPGGVRNAMFMTAGMGHMPFGLFAIRDSVAALIATTLFYQLGYSFGELYPLLLPYLYAYERLVLFVVLLLLGTVVTYFWYHRKVGIEE